jgi:16S rRNA (cytosine1402-N4)-methyltransferase
MHIPVLLQEAVDGLDIRDGDVIVDGTLGSAGHGKEMLSRAKDIRYIGIDRDGDALKRATAIIGNDPRATLIKGSYRDMEGYLAERNITGVTKVLFDFGFSSDQLASSRGFTFEKDEPLLMTFSDDPADAPVTARDILNRWDEDVIRAIIRGYGEERWAGRIAKSIVKVREMKPFVTTFDLVEAVKAAVPAGAQHGRLHPATRTFQAIRIAVNDELTAIEEGLSAAYRLVGAEGRIAAISFHSLEDRIVKRMFKTLVQTGRAEAVTKKPITATEEEIQANPRSRSAKLRIIKKITST